MGKAVTVVVNENDENVVQAIARILRGNSVYARQIRDFGRIIDEEAPPRGLAFAPKPGQLLACHFGLGFQVPEIVKTRPVLVISPKRLSDLGLCTVIPISHTPPDEVKPYHYKLPQGIVPNKKYQTAWLKGNLVQTVGLHRLDRLKVGPREYISPLVPNEILKEARRCVLHITGMDHLTVHL